MTEDKNHYHFKLQIQIQTWLYGKMNTSNADKVDFPQPLVPHNSTVTDSFLSRILQ